LTDYYVPARPDLTPYDLSELEALLRDHRQVRRDQLVALDLQEHLAEGLDPQDRLRTTAVARALLTDIEAALGRLREGTYGWCARCLVPIPRERLLAVPHVAYCVGCATA
jgi:RNA polymerase-binding transcription factor DksA